MKDISPWRDRQLTASGPIETGDVILVPINTAKYVYFKIFGQILGWGTSIAGVAAWSGS